MTLYLLDEHDQPVRVVVADTVRLYNTPRFTGGE